MKIEINSLNAIVIDGKPYNSIEAAAATVAKSKQDAGELDVAILTHEGEILQRAHLAEEAAKTATARAGSLQAQVESLAQQLEAAKATAKLAEM